MQVSRAAVFKLATSHYKYIGHSQASENLLYVIGLIIIILLKHYD